MSPTPDLVKVYRKSTGKKLQRPMHREDVHRNPDLAIVPSHRDRAGDLDGATVEATPQWDDFYDGPLADDEGEPTPQMSTDPVEQTQATTDDPAGSEHEKE